MTFYEVDPETGEELLGGVPEDELFEYVSVEEYDALVQEVGELSADAEASEETQDARDAAAPESGPANNSTTEAVRGEDGQLFY